MTAWLETALNRLAATSHWTYLPVGPRAAEPAALAALALVAHGRAAAAHAPLDWLASQQTTDGAVGVLEKDSNPAWTTAWAVLAWQAAAAGGGARRRSGDRLAIERGVDWLLNTRGQTTPNHPEMGHDCMLVGWPWTAGSHSWIEPTALAVLALKASGAQGHPRTVEGLRLLADRLLPQGGCNYGNTVVLGQELRPHVQPTGICLWALAGSPDPTGLAAKAIDYLETEVATQTATASLCYALLGLAAHGRRPATSDERLGQAAERTLRRAPSTYRLALLAFAAAHCLATPPAGPAAPPDSAAQSSTRLAIPSIDAPRDLSLGASLPGPCDWT